MLSRDSKFAVLAIFGVLAVFMFHAASGPFSAVNGPAADSRTLEDAFVLMVVIATAVLSRISILATTSHLQPRSSASDEPAADSAGSQARCSILLC
jgi:hypothetical protein